MEKDINIIKVEFGRKNNLTVSNRYQYDKGQIIKFLDIPDGAQVEFANENHERAEPYMVKNSQVEIPDFLLEENSPIVAYVKVVDENSETTIKTITIPVTSRPESDDGVPLENQQTFKQQIQEIMNSTKEIAQSVRDDANAGVFKGGKGEDGHTPVKGTDYFTESDIEEISNVSAEKVIEEMQPQLNAKVPSTRKVAGLSLDQNIEAYDLINAIKDYSPFFIGVQNALKVKYVWENILKDKDNEFAKAVQAIGGTLDSLETTDKSSYVSALNELLGIVSEKVNKNDLSGINKLGLVQIPYGGGIGVSGSGSISVDRATNPEIEGLTNQYKPIVPANLRKAVETIGGVVNNLNTEDKSNYVSAINEVLKFATRERTWKKIRTITVPSDEFKGQTVDGVRYGYSGENGIKDVGFKTDEDGNMLSGHKITGVQIKLIPTTGININQGFISIGSMSLNASTSYTLNYFTTIKNTTNIRWFEATTIPTFSNAVADNPGRHIYPGKRNNFINVLAFGGHEATSVLGEGTKIEVWAYGYWDGEEIVNG